MLTADCPQQNELRSFHLGMLDERREEEILEHLTACPICEETLSSLDESSDSLIRAVRHAAGDEAADGSAASPNAPEMHRALAELESLVDPSTEAPDREASVPAERIRDYELLETLGEGGMGTVYRARHSRLDREVAIKLLPFRRLRNEAAVARFQREMKAIGRLDHPTIVRATDAGDVDGTHFLAMDYVEGVDLSRLVRLLGPLDVADACEIVRQAAIGLDYAHEQGLIHRDVKPSNLMLNLRGEVRILDLGLALFGAASEAVDELTTVGQLMGTLDYMAPEQGDNSHSVDARADIYSLGATLFKLLTGSAPYDAPDRRTPLARMKALATIDAPSISDFRDELPEELVDLIARALSRGPNERFATAGELATALTPFCEGQRLEELVARGQTRASELDEVAVRNPVVPSCVREAASAKAAETRNDVPGQADRSRESTGRQGLRALRWMMLPVVLMAGVVIWIETDKATLVLESPLDELPVELHRGDKVYERRTLSLGKNELTVRSGTYEIVIPTEFDSAEVSEDVITLSRGGQQVIHIRERTDNSLSGLLQSRSNADPLAPQTGMTPGQVAGITAPQGPEPVYSGRTFAEWKHIIQTERNPEDLLVAIGAFGLLGREGRDREAAETILSVVERFSPEYLTHYAVDRAMPASQRLLVGAISELSLLEPNEVGSAAINSIRHGNVGIRRLILENLARATQRNFFVSQREGEPLRKWLSESMDFASAIIAAWPTLDATNVDLAFFHLTHCERSPELNRLVTTFLAQLIEDRESRFHAPAIFHHIDLHEEHRSRMAGLLLEYLESPDEPGAGFSPDTPKEQWPSWWTRESAAWMGLAACGKHASSHSSRIAALLEKANGKVVGRGIDEQIFVLSRPVSRKDKVHKKALISKRVLIYEILGRLGEAASGQVGVLRDSIKRHFDLQIDPEGEFGFVAAEQRFVIDLINLSPDASEYHNIGFGPEPLNLQVQALNSALLAFEKIAGQPASFDGDHVSVSFSEPPASAVSAMARTGFEEEYGDSQHPRIFLKVSPVSTKPAGRPLYPVVKTFRGRTFKEWVDLEVDSDADVLSRIKGLAVLSTKQTDAKVAAELASQLREILVREPFWRDGQEVSNASIEAGVLAAEALSVMSDELLIGTGIEILKDGPDHARESVLRSFAHPTHRDQCVVWPVDSDVASVLNSSAEFRVQFQQLLASWRDLPVSLVAAAIHYGERIRLIQTTEQYHIWATLLDADDVFLRIGTAMAVLRSASAWTTISDQPPTSQLIALCLKCQAILLDALEQTPDGVDPLEVALTLPLSSQLAQSELRLKIDRLLELLKKEHEADNPALFQIRLSQMPGNCNIAFGANGSMTPPSSVSIQALTETPKTLSRRILMASLLTRCMQRPNTFEANYYREMVEPLLESLPSAPEGIADRTPSAFTTSLALPRHRGLLSPDGTKLDRYGQEVSWLWNGPFPGLRLKTAVGGDAVEELQIYRELLEVLARDYD